MKIRIYTLLFWMLSLILTGYCAAAQSPAAEVPREDLSACQLPHGFTQLPKAGSPKARKLNGYIFNFKEKRLAFDHFFLQNKEPGSFKEFRDAVIAGKLGDIYFESVGKDLFFLALSGRIKSLGKHYLFEFDGKELAEPEETFLVEDGEKIPGVLQGIRLGDCYLMTTVDGQLVLFRIISVDEDRRACAIQWIERALNAKTFDIPKGTIIQPKIKPKPTVPATTGKELIGGPSIVVEPLEHLKAMEQFRKATQTHLNNRKSLIQSFITILKTPHDPRAGEAKKARMLTEKAFAIRTLGEMRAAEVAPLLASMIDAPISAEVIVVDADTIYNSFGCVPALIRIGKPGAAACLDAIANLTLAERERPYKEKLLCYVILHVEGENIARLLLEERKKSVSEEQQIENLERALALISEVKSWGGPSTSSQLKEELVKVETEKVAVEPSFPVSAETGLPAVAYVLIGAVAGMGALYLILLLKKKASSRGKSRAT